MNSIFLQDFDKIFYRQKSNFFQNKNFPIFTQNKKNYFYIWNFLAIDFSKRDIKTHSSSFYLFLEIVYKKYKNTLQNRYAKYIKKDYIYSRINYSKINMNQYNWSSILLYKKDFKNPKNNSYNHYK